MFVKIGGVQKELTAYQAKIGGVLKEVTGGYANKGGVLYPLAISNLPEAGLPLENYTWEEISTVSKAGKASEYWAVGDQKTITVNGVNYAVDIIGFNHDTPTDIQSYGRSKAGVTFQLHKLLSKTYKMNSTGTNSGGWSESQMRKNTLSTLFTQLNIDLQEVIVPVDKLTSGGNKSTTIKTSSDNLFLLSEIEIFGTCVNSATGEGSQYIYYASGNGVIKQKGSNDTAWWTRSPYHKSTSAFCRISTAGASTNYSAQSLNGVSFAFCV